MHESSMLYAVQRIICFGKIKPSARLNGKSSRCNRNVGECASTRKISLLKTSFKGKVYHGELSIFLNLHGSQLRKEYFILYFSETLWFDITNLWFRTKLHFC